MNKAPQAMPSNFQEKGYCELCAFGPTGDVIFQVPITAEEVDLCRAAAAVSFAARDNTGTLKEARTEIDKYVSALIESNAIPRVDGSWDVSRIDRETAGDISRLRKLVACIDAWIARVESEK